MMLWIVVVAALLLSGLAWRLSHLLAEKQGRLAGIEISLMDLMAERQEAKTKKAAALEQQKIVEKSVDTGAASAEVIHKSVASVTFGVLDSIPATEGVSKLVRGLHDGIAGTIYSTVRTSNKQVGNLAKDYINLKKDYDKVRKKAAEQKPKSTPQGEPGDKPAGEKKGSSGDENA